ncbi:fumarylacetoacetate hydrolase family protein [Halobium palmae]|uniref:Fumarylacetoacetate hydrolase family protein n=1 Tax=Halobium palmae TaxID=1776492 RepID=A0ABD5RWK5_9EURY
MRLARIRTPDGVSTGEYDDGTVRTDDGAYEVDDGDESVTLLAPCEPSACYCVGRNYAATLDQMDYDVPDAPDWFIKPPASVHDPGAPVPYPSWTEELTYAGELAAVVDRRCHEVGESEVDDVIRGYTIMNDLDALDQPGRTARKAFDGSAPLGPWIETDVDPADIEMTTHVGGELRQEATTAQMLFSPREVVSFLSERYTFRPGDVIAFGSPANPGLVEPGEAVEIRYEGVGTLRNVVVAE